MELICGVPLGILAGDFPKEPLPDPVLFIPRVEGQGDLLEQAGFFRDSATDTFIKHIEIIFIGDFIGFFNPAPTQIPSGDHQGPGSKSSDRWGYRSFQGGFP